MRFIEADTAGAFRKGKKPWSAPASLCVLCANTCFALPALHGVKSEYVAQNVYIMIHRKARKGLVLEMERTIALRAVFRIGDKQTGESENMPSGCVLTILRSALIVRTVLVRIRQDRIRPRKNEKRSKGKNLKKGVDKGRKDVVI